MAKLYEESNRAASELRPNLGQIWSNLNFFDQYIAFGPDTGMLVCQISSFVASMVLLCRDPCHSYSLNPLCTRVLRASIAQATIELQLVNAADYFFIINLRFSRPRASTVSAAIAIALISIWNTVTWFY